MQFQIGQNLRTKEEGQGWIKLNWLLPLTTKAGWCPFFLLKDKLVLTEFEALGDKCLLWEQVTKFTNPCVL